MEAKVVPNLTDEPEIDFVVAGGAKNTDDFFSPQKKVYIKWPEKPKPKLTKLQQEMEDEKIRQKAEKKRLKAENKALAVEIARKIAEAEEALRLRLEAEAEAERLRIIEESKIKLAYIPHNPKNKPNHPVLDNIEKILYEQEEEERHSLCNGCWTTITLLLCIAGVMLILFGLHRTVIFQSEPFRPKVVYAGAGLCSSLLLWLIYCCCPGRKELARRKEMYIRRKCRQKAASRSHLKSSNVEDADEELRIQAEYRKYLENFKYSRLLWEFIVGTSTKQRRNKEQREGSQMQKRDSDRKMTMDAAAGDLNRKMTGKLPGKKDSVIDNMPV